MTKIFRILSALSLVLGGIQVTWSLAGEGPHRAPPLPRAQQIASTNDLELLVAAARTHPERVYSAVLTADVAVPNDRSTSTGEMSLAAQTVTSVNVPSNRLTIPGHGFANGDALVFASTGTLPSPLTAGTPYFCIVIDPNTIELAGQYSYQAVADRSLHLDLTTSGSGRIAVTNKYPQAPGIAQRTLTVVSPLFQPTDIGKWISVSGAGYKGEDLLTTIASYKSPTQVVLLAGTSATIKSSTVKLFYELPKNIIISASDGGTFTGASGGLLAINTGRISVPPVQLFKSFAAGTVKFTDQIPETVYPEWFGAKGDTVLDTYRNYVSGTDDLAAFNAMIASSGKVVGDYTQGTLHIVLSNGKTYYLSDTLNVDTQVLMEGLAGTQNVVPALKFAANKTGIVQHSLSTNTGGYLLKPYRSADFSIFRNFAVLGTVGSTNMNVTVDLETINSIPNTITLNENSGGINMSAGNGFQNGNTITIGSWTYVFDNVQSSTKVTLKKPRLFFYSFSTNGAPTPYIYRGSYDAYVDDWLNQKIRLPDNQVFKIIEIVHSPGEYPGSDRIKLGDVNTGIATNWVPYGNTGQYMGTAYLESLAITSQNATANIYHGMDIRGQTQIENMTIREFAGNGIEGNSQSFPSWNLGNVPNLNNSVIRRNTLYQNKGNGLRMFGINSNQILIEINDSSYNKGAGYMEQSLLGNTYVGNHSSYNTYAPHYADTAANSSLFLNEYEETDGTSSRFGGYNIELGGNLSSGGGIDTLYGSKNWYRAEQGQMQPENLKVQSTVSNQTVAMLTPGDEAGAILGFGAADETLNTGSGGTTYNVRTPAYRLRYYPVSSDPYSGWYGFEYGTNLSKVPFLFSGANAGDGSGKMWMPFGFYLGYQGSPARHTIGVDPEGLTVDGAKLPSVKALIKEVTGDYSLTPADIGYTIFVDSAADVTLSVPAGLGKAARFTIIRKGPGNVSIIPKQGGGVVIGQADGYSRLRNRYSVAELVADRENVFVLYGDLKP